VGDRAAVERIGSARAKRELVDAARAIVEEDELTRLELGRAQLRFRARIWACQ
jgi:hypothetical protein